MAAADLNRDGRPEIILANYNQNAHSYIYWGQAGGPYGVTYSPSARTELPTDFGHFGSVADLNSDGLPEVIFANHPNIYIYWGQVGGLYGVNYTTTARTDLPAIQGRDASAVDLNSDGRPFNRPSKR